MKIAFVSTIFGYPWGGADTLWTRAAEAAAERGDRLMISIAETTAEHPRIQALVATGARLMKRRPPEVPRTIGKRISGKLTRMVRGDDPIVAALADYRPDLAVFSQGGTYDLVGHPSLRQWLRDTGTAYRLIANWQLEAPDLPTDAIGELRTFFEQADRICFVSTRNLEITRRHLGIPMGNALVLQNPLRWKEADVSPWPPENPWSLATVTRFEHVKGVDLLIEAAAEALPAGDPSWRLRLYGRGSEEAGLRALASRLGIGSQTQFCGFVPDLRAIWAENHLMVSPAREEGVPMTVPEAMLCQRPVLATPVGGAADWIEHGKTGFLCPSGSRSGLAATLRDSWDRRSTWRSLGLEAARAASARYRPDDYLQLIHPPHESVRKN